MLLSGLISRVFLEDIYEDMEVSRRAWAFMMRSMLALHPYSPVTSTQGLSTTRSEVTTCGHDRGEISSLSNQAMLQRTYTTMAWRGALRHRHEWRPCVRGGVLLAASMLWRRQLVRKQAARGPQGRGSPLLIQAALC